MTMRSFILLISIISISSYTMAQSTLDLSSYRWSHRLIFVLASESSTEMLDQQQAQLEKWPDKMQERDLKYWIVTPEFIKGEKLPVSSQGIMAYFNAQSSPFTCLLIGKDGGIKLRKNEVIEISEVFRLIDSMPMRQAEMRSKN